MSIPGVFSITGNSNKYGDPNNPQDTTYDRGYYFPMYDIGVTLDECPGPRTAVTATTEAAPQISKVGNVFTSTADSGNQWYLNDTAISGATGVTYTAQLPGTYYTVVSDPVTGCQLISNKLPYSSSTNPVTVSPNPSNGAFQLQFLFNSADNTAVVIYDMLGQRVYEQQLGNYSGYFSGQIDAVNLASGIYVLKVIHGGSTYQKEIKIIH
jgi:hypothetical protein